MTRAGRRAWKRHYFGSWTFGPRRCRRPRRRARVAFLCGTTGWGIGAWFHCHDEACFCGGLAVYGHPPPGLDPRDFEPDTESCEPEEIAAWKRAMEAAS